MSTHSLVHSGERVCTTPGCGYCVAASAFDRSRLHRKFPRECPRCGGDLTIYGGGDHEE